MPAKSATDVSVSLSAMAKARRFAATILRNLAGDIFAGAIVAAVNIALAISFTAVIFQGDLEHGFSMGLWAMLTSMVIIGISVGLLTSMPPLPAGRIRLWWPS